MNEQSQTYLHHFLRSLKDSEREKYQSFSADYFCADEANANSCVELIRLGQKTATCSLHQGYACGEEQMPTVGHLQVVLDWSACPVCIIEIDTVETCKFGEVRAEFAFAEGEGDRSLEQWRKAHWHFFAEECAELGVEPNDNMLLVLERFRVVYP